LPGPARRSWTSWWTFVTRCNGSNCLKVEKTSDGPIGKGTTFSAKKGLGRLETDAVVLGQEEMQQFNELLCVEEWKYNLVKIQEDRLKEIFCLTTVHFHC
jgi:hypothetical protein